MAKVTGIISQVHEKEWENDSGDIIYLYSFQLENNRKFFRTGRDQPDASSGDAVRFEVDAKNNVDLDTLDFIDASEVKKAPRPRERKRSQATASNGNGGLSRDQYWQNRESRDVLVQKTIQYQSARNAAIDFVKNLADLDALPKFKAGTSAKKAEIVEAALEHYTQLFMEQLPADAGSQGASSTRENQYADEE